MAHGGPQDPGVRTVQPIERVEQGELVQFAQLIQPAPLVERVRRWSAPLIALTASCLVLCCLETAADLALDEPALRGLTPDVAGWAALAVGVAVAVAALALLTSARVGPGPALVVGALGAVLGVALSRDVTSGAQLVAALLALAVAAGASFAAGLAVADPHPQPQPWSKAAIIGWALPWAAGWAPLAWLSLHARPQTRIGLGLHMSGWLAVVAAGAITTYGLLCLMVDLSRRGSAEHPGARPARGSLSGGGWENCWAALSTLVGAVASVGMLLGFQSDPGASWARPVLLLTGAAAIAGLAVCGWLVPDVSAQAAYCAVAAALVTGPSCVALLLLVPARESGPLSAWAGLALTVAALVGWWAGWAMGARRSRGVGGEWTGDTLTVGLLMVAVGAAAAWVMPSSPVAMVAVSAPLCAGIAAAVATGVRQAAATVSGLRFVAAAGLTALLLGMLGAFPLTWALDAELSGPVADERAGGRVLLGLTFVATVLAAGVTSVLGQRARQGGAPVRRPAEPAHPPEPCHLASDARNGTPPSAEPGWLPAQGQKRRIWLG